MFVKQHRDCLYLMIAILRAETPSPWKETKQNQPDLDRDPKRMPGNASISK